MLGQEHPHRSRTMSAGRTFAFVVLTLALAVLADSESLLRRAEQLPYGARRDFWTSIWTPAADVADVLYVNRPRRWLDSEGQQPSRRAASAQATAAPSPSESLDAIPPAQAEIINPDPVPIEEPAAIAPEPEPTPAPPAFRPASVEDPLRVFVGGDSLAVFVGQSLLRQGGDTGLITGTQNTRISTGLTRPDYFDWPAELAYISHTDDPDVIVMLLGTNDGQSIRTPEGRTFAPGTDGWREEYRRRVAEALDSASRPGRLIVWVGLPPMRSSSLNSRAAEINDIIWTEVTSRENARYVDSWDMFDGDTGAYEAYIRLDDGNVRQVREQDGIHFTRAGADIVASAILFQIGDTFGMHSAASVER